MSEHLYQGRKIIVTAGQGNDQKWICQFVIVQITPSDMRNHTARVDGRFGSRQAAEAAALKAAKAYIDSH